MPGTWPRQRTLQHLARHLLSVPPAVSRWLTWKRVWWIAVLHNFLEAEVAFAMRVSLFALRGWLRSWECVAAAFRFGNGTVAATWSPMYTGRVCGAPWCFVGGHSYGAFANGAALRRCGVAVRTAAVLFVFG
ncbi:hypothetical protein ERJ75_001213800 [Trypanosoma vivax]|nr:hypothetical protein ERJ75_001213800 [Trypanosoma vivax]